MSAPPLKVAIAGLGFGEAVHLPALRACPGTEPVALWHPRPERLEAQEEDQSEEHYSLGGDP